ncbi:MAG TPA: hypothetical protein PK626_05425 [Bacteroidales bacterium]|nr:hypothetical protein [Bacteroidales bacterium]
MERNVISKQLGMEPVAALPSDMAKLKPTINEEAILHDGDVVTIPSEISWGKMMVNGKAIYAVPSSKLNAAGVEEPYALFPHTYRRRVTVGRLEGSAFIKEEVLTIFKGTFVDFYNDCYLRSGDVHELMSKLKGKKFRATQIGTDSRPSMGFITKDGIVKASPLAELADPREKKLWDLELVD